MLSACRTKKEYAEAVELQQMIEDETTILRVFDSVAVVLPAETARAVMIEPCETLQTSYAMSIVAREPDGTLRHELRQLPETIKVAQPSQIVFSHKSNKASRADARRQEKKTEASQPSRAASFALFLLACFLIIVLVRRFAAIFSQK